MQAAEDGWRTPGGLMAVRSLSVPATAVRGHRVSVIHWRLMSSAANRLIGEVVQSQRRPLLGVIASASQFHVYLPWG